MKQYDLIRGSKNCLPPHQICHSTRLVNLSQTERGNDWILNRGTGTNQIATAGDLSGKYTGSYSSDRCVTLSQVKNNVAPNYTVNVSDYSVDNQLVKYSSISYTKDYTITVNTSKAKYGVYLFSTPPDTGVHIKNFSMMTPNTATYKTWTQNWRMPSIIVNGKTKYGSNVYAGKSVLVFSLDTSTSKFKTYPEATIKLAAEDQTVSI